MPQPFLRSPFRAFPSQKSCTLSGHQLPCSYSPARRDATPEAVHREFPRRPRSHAVACIPSRLWAPFRQQRSHLLVTLSPGRRSRPNPPAASASKPCSSCESVCTRPSFLDRATVALLDVRPSEAFSPRASDPQTPSARRRRRLWTPKAPASDRMDLSTPSARCPAPCAVKRMQRRVGSPWSPSRPDRATSR